MRVISGSARGLKLCSPDGIDTRPTLDRVKEALFSMLLPYISDANVLDLFSGSGALGIEALSRGAKKAVLVDNSNKAVFCIKTNITSARFVDKTDIICTDFVSYLKSCKEKFDLIFLDPPYKSDFYETALKLIAEKNLLSEDGLIVAEWDNEIGFIEDFFVFSVLKEKKYGRVNITVLKRG